jgi:hypothetical protein
VLNATLDLSVLAEAGAAVIMTVIAAALIIA